jgi:hypothetical protein
MPRPTSGTYSSDSTSSVPPRRHWTRAVSAGCVERLLHFPSLPAIVGFLGGTDDEVEEELRLMKLSEENERELHAQTNFWHIFQRFPSLPAIVGFLGGTLSGGEEGQAEHTV